MGGLTRSWRGRTPVHGIGHVMEGLSDRDQIRRVDLQLTEMLQQAGQLGGRMLAYRRLRGRRRQTLAGAYDQLQQWFTLLRIIREGQDTAGVVAGWASPAVDPLAAGPDPASLGWGQD